VDTGSSVRWKEVHPKELTESFPIFIKPNEHLDTALDSIGFSPRDIDCVINTHLHYDHCGNNELFPNSTFLVNDSELFHALSPGWWEAANYVRAVFDIPKLKYETIKGDLEVQDGINIISTPGHTEGHQSVTVELEKTGTLVLAGDAIYLRENLEHHILPGIYVDAKQYADSMSKLKHLVDVRKGTMLMSHSRDYLCPEGWKNLKEGTQTFE